MATLVDLKRKVEKRLKTTHQIFKLYGERLLVLEDAEKIRVRTLVKHHREEATYYKPRAAREWKITHGRKAYQKIRRAFIKIAYKRLLRGRQRRTVKSCAKKILRTQTEILMLERF